MSLARGMPAPLDNCQFDVGCQHVSVTSLEAFFASHFPMSPSLIAINCHGSERCRGGTLVSVVQIQRQWCSDRLETLSDASRSDGVRDGTLSLTNVFSQGGLLGEIYGHASMRPASVVSFVLEFPVVLRSVA